MTSSQLINAPSARAYESGEILLKYPPSENIFTPDRTPEAEQR
jgi:hypothetical protein